MCDDKGNTVQCQKQIYSYRGQKVDEVFQESQISLRQLGEDDSFDELALVSLRNFFKGHNVVEDLVGEQRLGQLIEEPLQQDSRLKTVVF